MFTAAAAVAAAAVAVAAATTTTTTTTTTTKIIKIDLYSHILIKTLYRHFRAFLRL